MANYLITMPDVGEGIAEVEITEWCVQEGSTVAEDDVLCLVMTDKTAVEIPCPVDGKVLSLGAPAGTSMAVGADLILLEVSGEGNSDKTVLSAELSDSPQPSNEPASVTQPAAEAIPAGKPPSAPPGETTPQYAAVQPLPRPEGERPLAAPSVRRRAREAGIDLRRVAGSGPAHRISHDDLDRYMQAPTSDGAAAVVTRGANSRVDEVPISGLRAEIARRMQRTKQRIPHYSYIEAVDVTELQRLRERLNSKLTEGQSKLTVLPFIIRGLVKAVQAFPAINAQFDDEANVVRQFGALHAGIATQTDRGLVVTVLRHAEALSLQGMAKEIKRLSEAARTGRATRQELTGSTLTISSLGPYGGIATTPVINAPELAIVGVNKVEKRPVWENGQFVPRDMMNLSSSFDHRIIDGWEATQFIHYLKDLLENPAELFIDGDEP